GENSDQRGDLEGLFQAAHRTLAPGDQRSDAGQEDEKERDGYVDAVVIRRVDGFLFACESFHNDREQGSPQDGKAAGEKNEVVEKEAGLTRDDTFEFHLA